MKMVALKLMQKFNYQVSIGEIKMATKSFMTDLTFDEKSADNLIQVLSGHSKVKRQPTKVEMIKSSDVIKDMFMKK